MKDLPSQTPQFVEVEIEEDVGLNNLQSGGLHHVFGEDGTHVVLKVSDEGVETASSEPRFQVVEKESPSKGVVASLLDYFRS